MSSNFDNEKKRVISEIVNGIDLSPKGSIDEPIVHLVQFINGLDNYVTTSSCSGRISMHVSHNDESKGIEWLFVEHGVITTNIVKDCLIKLNHNYESYPFNKIDPVVTFKCEPLILHVQCRDVTSGQTLQQIVYNCGMRESGLNCGKKKTMLAIRTTSDTMDFPIALGGKLLISDDHLNIIVKESNSKLLRNFMKIDKILLNLKKEFKFPVFHIIKSHEDRREQFRNIQRWGHHLVEINSNFSSTSSFPLKVSLMSTKQKYLICSGYGLESNSDDQSSNSKPRRDISAFLYDPLTATQGSSIVFNDKSDLDTLCMQHGAVVFCHLQSSLSLMSKQILVVSGGRKSPDDPLGMIRLFLVIEKITDDTHKTDNIIELRQIISFTETSCTQEAKENIDDNKPCPRWGHTLTKLSDDSLLLYGGRNNLQVFDDCYILNLSIVNEQDEEKTTENHFSTNSILPKIICHWTKLNLKNKINETVLAIPSARYFHAAVAINWYSDIYRNCQLETPSVVTTQSSSNRKTSQAVVIHGGLNSLICPISLGDCFVIYPFRRYIENNCNFVNWEYMCNSCHVETQISNSSMSQSKSYQPLIYRFGHTLTDIGHKSLFICGGLSFENQENNDVSLSSSSSYSSASLVLHLMVNEENALFIADIHPISYLNSFTAISNNVFTQENEMLPCGACRVHHTTTVVDFISPKNNACNLSAVCLLGGGSHCLAFGPHFCESVRLLILCGSNIPPQTLIHNAMNLSKHIVILEENSVIANNNNNNDNNNNHNNESMSEFVIYVKTCCAKSVKLFLESHRLIDKTRRITSAQHDSFKNSLVVVCPHRFSESDTVPTTTNIIDNQSIECEIKEDEYKKYASVPVIEVFFERIMSYSQSLTGGTSQTASNQTNNTDLLDLFNVTRGEVRIGYQNAKQNKLIETSSHTKVKKFLDQFLVKHRMPITARSNYPSKYEIIGDVLMIPEHSFHGPEWKSIFCDSSYDIQQTKSNLLSGMAQCFFPPVSRIARKARIKNNGIRESQVEILWNNILSSKGSSSTSPVDEPVPVTGKGSLGWVTVVENSISYSFDITKVMFCSGNVTERMRMGVPSHAKDEVIVDMYCGVGYYTLPLLVFGQAKHVHAMEWNENSLIALRENLKQNNVFEKCTIYYGDNALTVNNPIYNLQDCADRICLGLLPSSVKSWPLAAKVARRNSKVIIHVHENVLDTEIEEWCVQTRDAFRKYFTEAGKVMKIEVIWLERVKSYAPHIIHVVLDLSCIPISSNA